MIITVAAAVVCSSLLEGIPVDIATFYGVRLTIGADRNCQLYKLSLDFERMKSTSFVQ
jgi:hypothetical protein